MRTAIMIVPGALTHRIGSGSSSGHSDGISRANCNCTEWWLNTGSLSHESVEKPRSLDLNWRGLLLVFEEEF